jgi:2-oxoglutarate ferredoxin oxidoreductase subunit alpha
MFRTAETNVRRDIMTKIVEHDKRVFMTGNEVVAWGALAAGARIMYGYPITPQNEIMHYWTRLSPDFGTGFLQTEDELSAGFTALGGVLGGIKAFSATAGPGNVLMQEPISMAEMMRIPAVWIIQQRGGPSTATVIYSQQETRLTCFGGNGEGMRIVYSPSNHQEMFDYVIRAFQTAWTYRFPTFVLGDGYQAKMREALTLYNPEDRGIATGTAKPRLGAPGIPSVDREPAHMRNTFNIEEELYDVLVEHLKDYDDMAPLVAKCEHKMCDDAELILVAHGIVSRSVNEALSLLRKAGKKVGVFRPVTIRPFPVKEMRDVSSCARNILVVESANGQLMGMVKENLYGHDINIRGLLRPGVGITAEDVVETVDRIYNMEVN